MNAIVDSFTNLMLTGSSSASLTKQDFQSAIKYAFMGFVTVGTIHATSTLIQKRVNIDKVLLFETTAMYIDPELTKRFVRVQTYINVNKWAYQSALINADSLLYLGEALGKKQISPVYNDKLVAFSHYRVCLIRLHALAQSVKDVMDQRHFVLICIEIDEIKKLLRRHVLFVLNLCAKFNVNDLIEQAHAELN